MEKMRRTRRCAREGRRAFGRAKRVLGFVERREKRRKRERKNIWPIRNGNGGG
jgi:hypothetical protein